MKTCAMQVAGLDYPPASPFSPGEPYPELKTEIGPPNPLYKHVRRLLITAGLDADRFGTPEWNPFSAYIRPGSTVLLKPNLVFHRHPQGEDALKSTITHASIIRIVADYALLALKGSGSVVIADVPLQSADFQVIIRRNGLLDLVNYYTARGAPVTLMDLRAEILHSSGDLTGKLETLRGDPKGYALVDLGAKSELNALSEWSAKFAVGDYDKDSTRSYHVSKLRNEYLVPKTMLAADVVINLPKLKTHKKAGITVALKNFVGICGHKSYLPHYREGGPGTGGDEFAIDHPIKSVQRGTINFLKYGNPAVYDFARRIGRPVLAALTRRHEPELSKVMNGSWYGNDTLWRTVLDMNKIILYADREGRLAERPIRSILHLVDGVWGGDGDGPLNQTPRNDGVLLFGDSAPLVDWAAALLMGLPPTDIKLTLGAVSIPPDRLPLTEASPQTLAETSTWLRWADDRSFTLNFRLPAAWQALAEHTETSQAVSSRS